MLSEATYTLDQKEADRLNEACKRNGLSGISDDSQSTFIPRVIVDARRIEENIDRALHTFQGRAHAEMGELLTPATTNAWANLREHVRAGCLCDPPNIDLNTFGEPVVISNEQFRPILRTKRGASALEGFHSHQKQWLGLRAQHSAEAGDALLADGALRRNWKRHNSCQLPRVWGLSGVPPFCQQRLARGHWCDGGGHPDSGQSSILTQSRKDAPRVTATEFHGTARSVVVPQAMVPALSPRAAALGLRTQRLFVALHNGLP